MEIRQATVQDLPVMMDLFEGARRFMVSQGNPNQWTGGYPSEEMVLSDIESGHAYVCEQGNVVVGTFVYIIGKDPTYAVIYEGSWPDEKPYGVIHRLAGKAGCHGVAVACIDWGLRQCPVMRIDTHANNMVMRNLLLKYGFSYCGIIHLEQGRGERLAFHICKE